MAARGLPVEEARRQLLILHSPEHHPVLMRPCTPGDGILQIAEGDRDLLIASHAATAHSGRWLKFVPASGASSRMFPLHDEQALLRLVRCLPQLAFYEDVERRLRQEGYSLQALLNGQQYRRAAALLHGAGLGFADTPKGLLKFHRYGTNSRTAFEEHLREMVPCLRSADGRCRAHFTILPPHRPLFQAAWDNLRPEMLRQLNTELEVGFSLQSHSSDTLALDQDGEPLRGDDGDLVLRPGGHGALLKNLNALQADLVFVKNIDNVCHERLRTTTLTCVCLLGGYVVRLQDRIREHLHRLESAATEEDLQRAEQFLRTHMPGAARKPRGSDPWERRQHLQQTLDRPLRVCGMVVNRGEPGGGPYWVREADGSERLQIVEYHEVSPHDAGQQQIFQASTHFNPVFMALAVRDHHDRPYDLHRYLDEKRFIVSRKLQRGRAIRVLERPGLWNGSMAHWNTVFVEVPGEVFSPAKNVFDLLRDEHQESARG